MSTLRSRVLIVAVVFLFLGAAFATAGVLPTRVQPQLQQAANDQLIDEFISPRLSPQVHYIMHQAMRGLAPWQMQNVVLVDYVHGGIIYANKPELMLAAHFLRPVPGRRGLFITDSGEVLAGPPALAPPPLSQTKWRNMISLPPATSNTGPFFRYWVNNSSWIATNIKPDEWPQTIPLPTPTNGKPFWYGYLCNAWSFHGQDSGYVYTGGFANTNSTAYSEAEAGVFIHTISSTKGFEPFVNVRGGAHFSPAPVVMESPLDYGCFNDGGPNGADGDDINLTFTVVSSTELAATFFGQLDSRLGTNKNPPPYNTVTFLATVPQSWGWNLAGRNELTDVVTSIAQVSPGPKGYNLDGSNFTMFGLENFDWPPYVGTGYYPNYETSACGLYPQGFPYGACTTSYPYGMTPLMESFPTPPAPVVFPTVIGVYSGMFVDICLGNLACRPPTPTPTPPPPTPTPR